MRNCEKRARQAYAPAAWPTLSVPSLPAVLPSPPAAAFRPAPAFTGAMGTGRAAGRAGAACAT